MLGVIHPTVLPQWGSPGLVWDTWFCVDCMKLGHSRMGGINQSDSPSSLPLSVWMVVTLNEAK